MSNRGDQVTTGQPTLLSAALFERDGALLAVRRKPGHRPFAGFWMPPLAAVDERDTAEDALRRHTREQFGVTVTEETFADTVYLQDAADGGRFVVNIFRAELGAEPMRFNAAGAYDDARWLAAGDLPEVSMPQELRESLLRLLAGESAPPRTEWTSPETIAAEAVPLAEAVRTATPSASEEAESEPPPDNRAGWDAISDAYQAEYYGDRDVGLIKWTPNQSDADLHILGDVRGQRVLVLGCGGGQDVVALDRIGAVAVGIDFSAKQIAYARKYAARHAAVNASFVEGDMADLSRFDDASFDIVLSMYALGYVEDAPAVLRDAARVSRGGGTLVIAVPHPVGNVVSSEAPYHFEHAYWSRQVDFDWTFEDGTEARLRDFPRTVAEWFTLVTDAGYTVERMLEPEGRDDERRSMVPYVLIIKARKR